jgi:hypothetical protein
MRITLKAPPHLHHLLGRRPQPDKAMPRGPQPGPPQFCCTGFGAKTTGPLDIAVRPPGIAARRGPITPPAPYKFKIPAEPFRAAPKLSAGVGASGNAPPPLTPGPKVKTVYPTKTPRHRRSFYYPRWRPPLDAAAPKKSDNKRLPPKKVELKRVKTTLFSRIPTF